MAVSSSFCGFTGCTAWTYPPSLPPLTTYPAFYEANLLPNLDIARSVTLTTREGQSYLLGEVQDPANAATIVERVELAGPLIGFKGKNPGIGVGYSEFKPVIDYCWCQSRPVLEFFLPSADANNVVIVE